MKRLMSGQRNVVVNSARDPMDHMRWGGSHIIYVVPQLSGSFAEHAFVEDDFKRGQRHNGRQSSELHSIDLPSSSGTFLS